MASDKVARCKKPHTIAKELIFPAATDLIVSWLEIIEEMGVDITDQLVCRLKAYEFAIQLDEATFDVHDAYLICYVRYLFQAEKRMVEDMLCDISL